MIHPNSGYFVSVCLKIALTVQNNSCITSIQPDTNWKKEDGNSQKTKDGGCYTGTILEHLLLENLICSLNIGKHGNIKLEDGDWNDQLDMAPDKGETIPFTAFYGKNMCDIADLLEIQIEKEDRKTISVFEEMEVLLEGLKEKEPQKEV